MGSKINVKVGGNSKGTLKVRASSTGHLYPVGRSQGLEWEVWAELMVRRRKASQGQRSPCSVLGVLPSLWSPPSLGTCHFLYSFNADGSCTQCLNTGLSQAAGPKCSSAPQTWCVTNPFFLLCPLIWLLEPSPLSPAATLDRGHLSAPS